MTSPVRVAMTVEQLAQPVPGGSGTYITELVAALEGHGGADVVGLAARRARSGAGDQSIGDLDVPVARSRLPRVALYESWNRWRCPRAERLAPGAQVVHATTWAVPGAGVPMVVTVHDLAFIHDPTLFTARGVSFFTRALERVVAEADAVVVPSQATADDCVRHGIDAARITVVPHGVRADAVTPGQVAAFRSRHRVDGPYLLWCGTLEPRKNVPRLVEAFAKAKAAGLEAGLVLVGPQGWGGAAQAVAQVVDGLPPGSVRMLGRLTHDELQAAYAGATGFVYPSLWEGFGMPVLEAMAHGVPVVTSADSPMAELVGPTGVVVPPRDVPRLAEALAEVGTVGQGDRSAVRDRAARYTWEASAAAHVEVYQAVLGG